jgi:hypothetical protein
MFFFYFNILFKDKFSWSKRYSRVPVTPNMNFNLEGIEAYEKFSIFNLIHEFSVKVPFEMFFFENSLFYAKRVLYLVIILMIIHLNLNSPFCHLYTHFLVIEIKIKEK